MPSVLWHCWLGCMKGIWPVKAWVVGCWHGYLSGVRRRLAYSPADATVSCFSKIQIGFTFLVPTHLGSPGQMAVKRVCVCVCLSVCLSHLSTAAAACDAFAAGHPAGKRYQEWRCGLNKQNWLPWQRPLSDANPIRSRVGTAHCIGDLGTEVPRRCYGQRHSRQSRNERSPLKAHKLSIHKGWVLSFPAAYIIKYAVCCSN